MMALHLIASVIIAAPIGVSFGAVLREPAGRNDAVI